MGVSIIVACDKHGVIGKEGKLPWRCSEDLKIFRKRTLGHAVIMGRKTWDSLPKKPLDGRPNIILTRNQDCLSHIGKRTDRRHEINS
jgi:dihydrofolate reductase